MTLNLVNRGCERRGPQELNDEVGKLKVRCIFFLGDFIFQISISLLLMIGYSLIIYKYTVQLVTLCPPINIL